MPPASPRPSCCWWRRAGAGGNAATDGFYLPPAGFEAGAGPVRLLKAEPIDAYLVPGARMRARAWRILYRSTSAIGEPRKPCRAPCCCRPAGGGARGR